MPQQLTDIGDVQRCNAALVELQRALKALTFYPQGHPLRDDILGKAYQALSSLAANGGMSLVIGRNGISFAGRDVAVEISPMTTSLARELFTREVQQLSMLPDMTFDDFTGFLSLLSLDPPMVIAGGGLDELLKQKGIHSVLANEIDISQVFTKRSAASTTEGEQAEPAGSSHPEQSSEEGFEQAESDSPDRLSELAAEELLTLMERESDDERYRLMARHLAAKGEEIRQSGEFDRLFMVILRLLKEINDGRKSRNKRDTVQTLIRQLTLGSMAAHLLDHLGDTNFRQREVVHSVIARLGEEMAEPLIERIISSPEQNSTAEFTALLVRIGPAAVAPLVARLKDSDMSVVKSAVVLLGELGCRESVTDLMRLASHDDSRIRMEAIRSLARIGGREATAMLMDLLEDKNPSVQRQTITWLGVTRNDKVLDKLLQIALKSDYLGKTDSIKKEAIIAIGRIGDRQALEPLCAIVKKRRLFASERWEEIKVVAIEAIAQLGGDSSRDFLELTAAKGGRIGKACSAALRSMERLGRRNEEAAVGEAGRAESGI